MSTEFTWDVVSVDLDNKTALVEYSKLGHEPIRVGCRLPRVGDDRNLHFAAYAPYGVWAERVAVYEDLSVGTAGVFDPAAPVQAIVQPKPATLAEAQAQKMQEIADMRYRMEVAGAQLPSGMMIDSDRETQAKVTSAMLVFQHGWATAIRWKVGAGVFADIDATLMAAIAKALSDHVRASFAWESAMCDQVKAATTIAEVQAIAVEQA